MIFENSLSLILSPTVSSLFPGKISSIIFKLFLASFLQIFLNHILQLFLPSSWHYFFNVPFCTGNISDIFPVIFLPKISCLCQGNI